MHPIGICFVLSYCDRFLHMRHTAYFADIANGVYFRRM